MFSHLAALISALGATDEKVALLTNVHDSLSWVSKSDHAPVELELRIF